jgi:hypothetical protein
VKQLRTRNGKLALVCAVISFLLVTYASRADAAVFDDAPRLDLGVGAKPVDIVTGDFNLDGKLDLAVADFAANVVGATDRVVVYHGDGKGGFAYSEAYGGIADPSKLAVADFNGDGREDLAVGSAAAGKNVTLLKGRPDGRFDNVGAIATTQTMLGLEVGDFNGDGKADLATTGFGYVSINLGDGAFGFTKTEKNVPGFPFRLAVDDYDGDGLDDVAVGVDRTGLPGGNWPYVTSVAIARSTGNGTLGPLVETYVPGAPGAVENGDFNSDGRPDLAVALPKTHRVAIRLGVGEGKFNSALPEVTVGTRPEAVAAVDVDADGHDDLISANADQNSISVRFGRGDGTFAAEDEISGGEQPVALTAGDFDGNGVTDWAAANDKGTGVTVRLGNSKPLLDGNLIVNGGFEKGQDGWTPAGGAEAVRYGTAPHFAVPTRADAARLGPGGLRVLSGGAVPQPDGKSSVSQTIDVAARGPFIDTGKGEATLSADLGGARQSSDVFTVTAAFLDDKGSVLGEVQVGPVDPAARRNVTTLLRQVAKKALPVATRSIRVTATSTDGDGLGSAALADNLKLTLELPATPVDPAQPAQPTQPQQPTTGGGGQGPTGGGAGPGAGQGPGGGAEGPMTLGMFGSSAKVTLTLAPKKSQRRGTVAVLVRNANAFAVRGTLTGTSGKGRRAVKTKGMKVALPAGGKATVRLKLPAKLRRELQRRGRVSIQLSAAVSDPAGNKRNVRKRVSTKSR